MNTLFEWIILSFSLISIFTLISFFFKPLAPYKQKKKESIIKQLTKKIISSLFISFDPKSSITIFSEMNWLVMTFILLNFFFLFWSKPSRLMNFISKFKTLISEQFEIALKTKKDGSKLIFTSMFTLIIMLNLMGLIPNLFTPTSHLTLNLFMSIPMWTGFFIFGWVYYTNNMFIHLVPNGTPLPLISFMVLIELISTLIRPLTLSIRLMTNMISGHLLLTLMGNMLACSNILTIIMLVFFQCLLSSLEIGVAMIQSYVFCMLMTLYSDDSDYSTGNH